MILNGSILNSAQLNGASDNGVRLGGGLTSKASFAASAAISAVLLFGALPAEAGLGGQLRTTLTTSGGIHAAADFGSRLIYTANLQRGISRDAILQASLFRGDALPGGVSADVSIGGQMFGSVNIDAGFLRLASIGGQLKSDADLESGVQATAKAGSGVYCIDASIYGGLSSSAAVGSGLRRASPLKGGTECEAGLSAALQYDAVICGGIRSDSALSSMLSGGVILTGGIIAEHGMRGDMSVFLRAPFYASAQLSGGLSVGAKLSKDQAQTDAAVGGNILAVSMTAGGCLSDAQLSGQIQASPRLSGFDAISSQSFFASLKASAKLQQNDLSINALFSSNPIGIGLIDPFINTRALYLTDHSEHYFLTIAYEDI